MPYIALKPMLYGGRQLKAGDLIGEHCKSSLVQTGMAKFVKTYDMPVLPEPEPLPKIEPIKPTTEQVKVIKKKRTRKKKVSK